MSLAGADTREEIFEAVASLPSDAVSARWVGTVDVSDWSLEAAAASDEDLSAILVPDDDSESGHPSVDRAISEGTVQAVPPEETAAEQTTPAGAAGIAIVPFTHKVRLYGLCVLGTRRNVIEERRDALGDLGTIVGHALTRVDCRTTLMGNTGVSVEFQVPDGLSDILGGGLPAGAEISIDRTVPLPDGSLLQFVTVRGVDIDRFRDRVEDFEDVSHIRLVTRDDGEAVFETIYTGPSIVRLLVEQGAEVIQSTFHDQDHYTVARVPEGRDVAAMVTGVTKALPNSTVVAQRSDVGDWNAEETRIGIRNRLTDRQRVVSESALAAGYFERPRESTGAEIADTLDISSSTFSQHLRAPHGKVYGALFGDER
ncbi:MAG: bacterio-opsin activator domain-containing protein [Halodesulfurarchaeum sp.]